MAQFERWERVARAGLLLTTCLAVWVLGSGPVAARNYVVQPGETLSDIADAAGVSLTSLANRNQIRDPNFIVAGQVIDVPSIDSPAGPPVVDYRIQPGDSLWSIAAMRQTTIERLVAANPDIVNPNLIRIDDVIRLPGGQTARPQSSTTASTPTASVPTLLTRYARAYGLEPSLVQAVAWQESGWRQGIKSGAGAYGVMQVLPSTGAWLASDIVGQPLDVISSADDNIHAGVAYLRFLIDRTGSVQLAVVAYYEGQGNLQQYGVLPDAQHYLDNVMAIRSHIMVYGTPPGA